MTRKEYDKLGSKIGNKPCPICGKQINTFIYGKTNIFCPTSMVEDNYEKIIIPDKEYFDIECEKCGYVMTFNMKKLLR